MLENLPTERQQVLAALDRLHDNLVRREEWTHSGMLGNLRDTLQSPLFSHILTLQNSVRQLRNHMGSVPPDAFRDFTFSRKGQLILSAVDPPCSTSSSSVRSNGSSQAPPPSDRLQSWIVATAKGRPTQRVELTRPLSGGLGFSVVGLNPSGSSSHGIFVKQIQAGGIAHRDGRLHVRDQILVINGSPLEPGVSQQQVLNLLQQPGKTVELVVARDGPPDDPAPLATPTSTDQWGHLEEVQLVNDGSGLGFGIVGGKTSGVVVRTLVPGSVADQDGRLRTGDHILRIGATPTGGLSSDQVVQVLQRCGSHVTMLIARDPRGGPRAPPPPPPPDSAPVASLAPRRRASQTPNLEGYEIHEVPLTKEDGQSLGISIIGYNPLTSQDAVGVFVKHVVPGSAADQSGNIRVHDRLIALDGVSLHGRTNQEVLEVMKQTGQTVVLTLVRKRARVLERSLDKVERESTRVALRRSAETKARSSASGSMKTKPEASYPNTSQLTRAPDEDLRVKWEQALGPNYQVLVVKLHPVIEDDEELQKSSKLLPIHTLRLGVELDSFDGHHYISSVAPGGPVDRHGLLRPEDELLEVNNVQLYGKSRREVVSFLKEVPPPFTLICCRLPVSDPEPEPEPEPGPGPGPGREPELEPEPEPEPGPTLEATQPPEPRLEEIEMKLSSMLLRDDDVHQEAGRDSPVEEELREETFHSQEEEEEDDDEEEEEEEEGELALWSPDVQTVELLKERERGLGFSLLDYQDPLDPSRCVMVIRSLVPGGSAERHGGLLPGDQLVSVNQTQLDPLTLAQAVEVLKSAPAGTVQLGIRKPLVEAALTRPEESSQVSAEPVPQGFGVGSILPDDVLQLEEEEEEEELILDGGLPRYASSLTADLLPLEESREMAVDEEEEEETASLSRKPPPSWEEWKVSSIQPGGALEMQEEDLPRSDRDSIASVGNLVLGLLDSRDSEADSELTLTDTDTESVRAVATARRKRRSQGGAFLPMRGVYSELPEREDGEGEETPAFSHWGPPRRVEVWPEDGQSLGLSIVGGRHVIKRLKNGEELKGIFIKQVLSNSPAAKSRSLKTGDKILEVSGVDLRAASHEEAVSAIKMAPSPVTFVVQSLSSTPRPVSVMTSSSNKPNVKRTESPKPEVAPPPIRQPPPYRPPVQSDQELTSDLEPTSDLEQAKGPF